MPSSEQLEPCRVCGHPVSQTAETCPNCGEKHPTPSAQSNENLKLLAVWILATPIIVLIGIAVYKGCQLCKSLLDAIAGE